METKQKKPLDYASAGVDISAGNRVVEYIKEAVKSTYDEQVLFGVGSFASCYDMQVIAAQYRHPVLLQSVDGVGTKMIIARMMQDYSTIGRDLVSACANDIAVHGAKPITFLDYVATDRLDVLTVTTIVQGVAEACRETHISLVGGETAEMPGIYLRGEHDLVGMVSGIAERDEIVDGRSVSAGDVILAVGSTGLHTNGYSLARKALFETAHFSLEYQLSPTETLGSALLATHANYTNGILALLKRHAPVLSMAHITGGGLIENVKRVLPPHLSARFFPDKWERHPIFDLIQQSANISDVEMYRTFNMGIGLTVVVPFKEAHSVLKAMRDCFTEPVWEVGVITEGEEGTRIEGVI